MFEANKRAYCSPNHTPKTISKSAASKSTPASTLPPQLPPALSYRSPSKALSKALSPAVITTRPARLKLRLFGWSVAPTPSAPLTLARKSSAVVAVTTVTFTHKSLVFHRRVLEPILSFPSPRHKERECETNRVPSTESYCCRCHHRRHEHSNYVTDSSSTTSSLTLHWTPT